MQTITSLRKMNEEYYIGRVEDMYVCIECVPFIGLLLRRSYTQNDFHRIIQRYLGKLYYTVYQGKLLYREFLFTRLPV